ncbi:MAG: radical SAM protein [bacterium]|nr:radical SAM protein [bacterium]
MTNCRLCPRGCMVDRVAGSKGRCGQTADLRLARAALHKWEEPCISGVRGSGTVFFSGCQLGCIYCQNEPIAHGSIGRAVTNERLCDIFFELQQQGANNINLVTPDHYVPQIVKAIERAKILGFSLPFVYNTGSYVTVETLRMLDGLIDIYLPDMKYLNETHAREYSAAKDYPMVAKQAIAEMYRQVGSNVFSDVAGEPEPMLIRGMIVRHLLLPGALMDAKAIVRYLYETYADNIYISLLNQYTPGPKVRTHAVLGGKVKKKNYDALVDYAISLGITNAFIQEGEAAAESFIPDFNYDGV